MSAFSLVGRRGGDPLVVALAVFAQIEVLVVDLGGSRPLNVMAALGFTLPMFARHRVPLTPLVGVVVLALYSVSSPELVDEAFSPYLALLLSCWHIGALARPRQVVAGAAVILACIVLVERRLEAPAGEYAFTVIIAEAALAAGFLVNMRARQGVELEQRAARLELDRAERARRAVAEERLRIARELHDVVGHSVSVMTVQAGAARMLLLAGEPEQARGPLVTIEETGHEALADMRRVLGILRRDMSESALEPAPSLSRLDTLVERCEKAGLPVVVHDRRGPPGAAARDRPLRLPRRPGGADERDQVRRPGPGLGDDPLRQAAARARGRQRRPHAAAPERQRPRARRDAGAGRAFRRRARGRSAPSQRIRRPRPPTAGGHDTMIRVLIADDQALVRGGFRMILSSQKDMEVVGEAENGRQAIALAKELQPDVVLMDIRMPELDGLEATRRLVTAPDAPRVLMLTTFDMNEYVYEAMKSGASGFLLKDVRPEQLAEAVRTVAAGDALLAPAITRRLIEEFVRRLATDELSAPPP
jgi:DNA-binding NarL/FixJ family response regulator/signal transduction histidine kinase